MLGDTFMLVRYNNDKEDGFEKKMSVDELVSFCVTHMDISYYKGVRFAAEMWSKKRDLYVWLRFDDIFECKLTEIKLKRLHYIKVKRAKWEDDYDFKANIRVSDITKNYMKLVGEMGDTYEDIIYVLLEYYFKGHERPKV